MKSVIVHRPGGYEALELTERADPQPGPGQVRVKVRAMGVNFADAIVRMGYYEAAKGLYPLVPGFEFSGTVDALGAGATGFKEGDRAFGITRFGGYASSIAVDPRQLWPCPDGWDYADCAGFPAVYLTAYVGLFRVAKVEPGETVLIHSAAGGMGTALLQLCRIKGCRAVGVVGSAKKKDICLKLGASAVIDRSSQDLWKEAERACPGGYDAIFDANGVTTTRPGYEHLAQGGRLVVYGFAEIFPRGAAKPSLARLAWNYLRVPKFSPLDMTGKNRGVAGFNVVYMFHKLDLARRAMTELLGWIKEGRIQKAPVMLFPLERAADAHRALESGATTGKLILTVG